MGSSPSLLKAAFCHPDLLAVLELQENHLGDFASRDVPSWHITPLLKIAAPDRPASHSVRKPVVSPNSVMTDSVAYDVPLVQRHVVRGLFGGLLATCTPHE